jgi:alginate O-acetyltransferase complex protein AlgI
MTLDSFARSFHWLPSAEFFSSAAFWAYFAIVVVALRLLPRRGVVGDLLLLGANVLMLLALPHFNGVALLIYGGLAVVTYCLGSALGGGLLARRPSSRLPLACLGVVLVLFVLAVFKYRFLQAHIIKDTSLLGTGASGFIFLIGISYSSFKAIHFIIESFKGTIKQPRFLDFLNFLLFFPAFVSGPINRFNDFINHSARAGHSSWRDDFSQGVGRIIHGLFKKFVITVILFPYTVIGTKVPLAEMASWQVLLCLYAYALYFYVDFSGYTDLAIGSARLLGFSLPENFNLPFLKKNLQQLWANWHMSLTGWLTDYVYWPLVRKMRSNEVLRKNPLVISNLAIIVTFFLCGAWHGPTFNFILWGLYHGIGIAAVNVYQKWKRQVRQPAALKYFASPLSYGLGVVLSFNFFAMGLLFILDAQQLASVLGQLF